MTAPLLAFEIRGDVALVENMKDIPFRIREQVREEIFALGVEAEGKMRARAPTLAGSSAKKNRRAVSGALRDSIRHKFIEYADGNVFDYVAPHGRAGKNPWGAPYAHLVEHGVNASGIESKKRGYRAKHAYTDSTGTRRYKALFVKERVRILTRRGKYKSVWRWEEGAWKHDDTGARSTYDLTIAAQPFVQPTRDDMGPSTSERIRAAFQGGIDGE